MLEIEVVVVIVVAEYVVFISAFLMEEVIKEHVKLVEQSRHQCSGCHEKYD